MDRSEEYMKIQKAQLDELQKTASRLIEAAMTGSLDEKQTVFAGLKHAHQQPGPSGGALYLDCMPATAVPLLRTLKAGDGVRLRQCITWNFPEGSLVIGVDGRQIYFYAGWPENLRQGTLYASDFAAHPHKKGMWAAGITNGLYPQVVGFGYNDTLAHHFVSGASGMGKTNCLLLMLLALGLDLPKCSLTGFSDNGDPGTWLVVCDPKKDADGLLLARGLANLVGPVATSMAETEAALAWAVAEMVRRNEIDGPEKRHLPRIVIVIDEVQIVTKNSPRAAYCLERLSMEARTARMHLCLVAHNPTKEQLGGMSILPECLCKQVYKTTAQVTANTLGSWNMDASILGPYEALAVHPMDGTRIMRAFKYDEVAFARLPRGAPQLAEWPALDASDYLSGGSITISPSPVLAAAAITAALKKYGRGKAQGLFANIGEPVGSNNKADGLVDWGKRVVGELSSNRLLRVGDS
jgi:hypothetical protein